MNHQGTILIQTNRLILRKFTLQDNQAIFQNWANDPQVTTFLSWQHHKTIETTNSVLQMWVDSYSNPNFYQWAITLQDNTQPIGSIGIVAQDQTLNCLTVGYCIGRHWWNQGITSEAFSAIIPFLFEKVQANRIEARHDPRNLYSGKVMKKCGLTYEGTLRATEYNNTGIADVSIYSILAEEYFQ